MTGLFGMNFPDLIDGPLTKYGVDLFYILMGSLTGVAVLLVRSSLPCSYAIPAPMPLLINPHPPRFVLP